MFTNNTESMKKTETTASVNIIGSGTTITGDVISKVRHKSRWNTQRVRFY